MKGSQQGVGRQDAWRPLHCCLPWYACQLVPYKRYGCTAPWLLTAPVPCSLPASCLPPRPPHSTTHPPQVKEAMNEINAAQRLRVAAAEKAEAAKVVVVKQAEAEAEGKYLQGAGVARQRQVRGAGGGKGRGTGAGEGAERKGDGAGEEAGEEGRRQGQGRGSQSMNDVPRASI